MTPPDVYTWRKAERRRLLAARESIPHEKLDEWRRVIDIHLQRSFPDLVHGIVAFCWPYRGEYDPRHFVAQLRRLGATAALPVVVAAGSPLVFRGWYPGVKMKDGPLGIPYPEDSEVLTPDHVLLPMLGWDGAGYRLGYGGGFFDRTLAALPQRPRVIGLAYELQYLPTIYPQPHDIPVDFVVTERGVHRREADGLRFLDAGSGLSSPVCYAGEVAPGYFGEPDGTEPGKR
jgi:5-formyltetrahydrofolate cyclo-ligase